MVRYLYSAIILSILISGTAFLICFAISFQSWGMEQGLVLGELELDEYRREMGIEKIQFSSHGQRTYQWLSSEYGLIGFFFLTSLLANIGLSMFRHPHFVIIAVSASFLALVLAFFNLWNLVREKQLIEEYWWNVPRNAFARNTVNYDWLLILFAAVLIGLQLFIVVSGRKNGTSRLMAKAW